MAIGKRLLIYSHKDPRAARLVSLSNEWGCLTTVGATLDELRGKIEGGDFDMVLIEDVQVLRKMIAESDPSGSVLQTPLAEIEKRHLLRVLSSTGGNKTRAARILGIDTKTLYNKLKAYNTEVRTQQIRSAGSGNDFAAH